MLTRTPPDYPTFVSRWQERMDRGRHREAWDLGVAFHRKRVLAHPAWLFEPECGRVLLAMARAALAGGNRPRAFYNARAAALTLAQGDNPALAAERRAADIIATEALAGLDPDAAPRLESMWDRMEPDYVKAAEAFRAGESIVAHWESAGPFRKWFMRRQMKKALGDPNMFGRRDGLDW
jgi:hypothetical protein